MKSSKTLLSFLFLFIIIGACKKNSDPPIERMLGLTNNNTKTWQITKQTLNGTPTILETCDKKKLYTFNANGKFYFNNIDTANCKTTFYLPDTGTWSFNTDKSQIIVVDSKSHNGQYNIEDLSSSYLRLLINGTLVRLEFNVKN